MNPGEFAVRYKDFKTGLARNPAGENVQSSEVCRIFSGLEEARADSRKVVNQHWGVRCFIYDNAGMQVDIVSNNKKVNKFAAAVYAGILLWVGLFTIVGMGLLWMLFKITLLILGPSFVNERFFGSGWLGWTAYAFAGLLLGVLAWLSRIRFMAERNALRMQKRLNATISSEEKERFAELNTLYGSEDPAERERFLKLASEYREKVNQDLKK